jgi:hypothetical protein
MLRLNHIFAVGAVLLLGACAHPINISPQVDAQPGGTSGSRSVAFVISQEDRDREVSKPTAGGDSVTYAPYRDLEAGLFQVLNSIYRRVTLLRSAGDTEQIERNGATLVFVPKIVTEVMHDNAFIWPPTGFEVKIEYRVHEPGGRQVYQNSAAGTGKATFGDMRDSKDFGLSGRRAAAAALAELRRQVENAPELK